MKLLKDGLILTTMQDRYREALPQFFYDVFSEEYGPEGEWDILPMAQDLVSLEVSHPTVTDDDIWLIYDPANENQIVSALILIPQVWNYEGISIPVGRPELIGTRKAYRRRGLVRELMNTAHQRSAQLGHLVQSITGIEHYYRQFGYVMGGVKLGSSSYMATNHLPNLPADSEISTRRATSDDLPILMAFHEEYCQSVMVSCQRDTATWAYELSRPSEAGPGKQYFYLILKQGQPIGYFSYKLPPERDSVNVLEYAIGDDGSLLETWRHMLHGAFESCKDHLGDHKNTPQRITLDNGLPDALHTLIGLTPFGERKPARYTWYLRAASPAKLVQHIGPVLEQRLAGSAANGYSGTLKIDFYDKNMLAIVFEKGKLISAADDESTGFDFNAGFPWHTFLNLIFGHLSLIEMNVVNPETLAGRDTTILLDILFPKKKSWVVGQL